MTLLMKGNAPDQVRSRGTDWWTLTAFSAALFVILSLASWIDPRLLDGVSLWSKPWKFAFSFVLYFGTIALVVDRMKGGARDGRWMAVFLCVVTVAYSTEMAYMIAQAAQQQHSHFNESTDFHRMMYQLMGIGAVLLILVVAGIGVMVLRDGESFGPGARVGIGFGFILTFLLTLIIAGYLGGNGSHHVGLHPEGGSVVPIMGWSREVGDLRPAHFLASHAMQALPIAGLLFDRLRWNRWTVVAGGIAYAALAFWAFGKALSGTPLL